MRFSKRLIYPLLITIAVYTPLRDLVYAIFHHHFPHLVLSALKYIPELLPAFGLILAAWLGWPKIKQLRGAPRSVKLAIILLGWSVFSLLYSSAPLWQAIRGVRIDFGGLMVFILVWLAPVSREQRDRLINVMIGVIVGLILVSIPEFFANHSFRVWAQQDLQRHFVGKIPQLRSMTPGPNPFGTLLTFMAGVVMLRRPTARRLALLALSGLVLGLTYTRSAWLGTAALGAGVFFYALRRYKRPDWRPALLAVALLLGSTIGILKYHESIKLILIHGTSTEEHAEIASSTVRRTSRQFVTNIVIGDGSGTAGPVTFNTGEEPVISESWYLQLVQELGLIGLGLYVALIYSLAVEFFRRSDYVIAWLTIGLAINSIFLHTWSSDYNINLMFWLLAGLALFAGPSLSEGLEKQQ